MKNTILILSLSLGVSATLVLGFIYLIVWLFSLGEFPNLDKAFDFVLLFTLISFLLNLLFGFRK